jgi:hypothetical protein
MMCTEARSLLPAYVDKVLSGAEMQLLAQHMSECSGCRSEYRKLENTRQLVVSLGRKPVPADLALRIRLALSRERSRSWRSLLQSYLVRMEDAVNAFMLPATAGIVSTVIFFGALTGFFVTAQTGAEEMVPGIYLPARLQPPQTAMSSVADMDLNLDAPVVIQAFVDANGHVQNYEIVAGPDTEKVRSQLNRALLFTSFSPAYSLGQPVAATAIICFSHVNVKG